MQPVHLGAFGRSTATKKALTRHGADQLLHFAVLARPTARRRATWWPQRARIIRLQRRVPPRLVDVDNQLESALARVLAGVLDPVVAIAAATIAQRMVMVLAQGSVEEQLKALERQGAVEPPTPLAG